MTDPVDPNAVSWPAPDAVYPPEAYQPPPQAYTPPPPFAPPPFAPPPFAPPPVAPPTPPYPAFPPGPFLGYPPPPYAPPPRRTGRAVLIAVLACVVLAFAGVALYVVLGDTAKPDRTAVPAAFDGYTHVTTGNAGQIESAMRAMVSSFGGKAADSATIALYARNSGDQPRLIAIVWPTSAFPGGSNPGQALRSQFAVLVPNLTTFPPGPNGGDNLCGTTQFGIVKEYICAWDDSVSVGAMVSILSPMTPRRLARIEIDFRSRLH
jgi:hypothetical protein